MQRPVVGARVTGTVDVVVPGEIGFLVEPHAPAQFAEAISALLSDFELRQEMGRAGRGFVTATFPRELIIRKTLALYCGLLK